MKKIYSAIFMVSLCLLSSVSSHAQNTVTIDFTGMDPHVGQSLFFRVVDVSDGSEVGRTSVVIASADFSLGIGGIMPGSSYYLDFYADFNENGKYDVPPTDHAWRIVLEDVTGDSTVGFAHNTTFTDIAWVHQITLAFSSMNPHVGQDLYLALKDAGTGWEIERKKLVVDMPDFNVNFDSITPDNSYVIDFFADYNLNGKYDPPADDHAWRITLENVKGDTTVPFIHNTSFTDIDWKYKLTVNFTGMTPHLDQDLKLYLRNPITDAFLDTVEVSPITTVDFSLVLFSIMPDSSYHIDFYVDFNENGEYDVPPEDHVWRILLTDIPGDTIVDFAHNTVFTDIGLGGPTGTNDISDLPGFTTYPNPVRDQLTIKFDRIAEKPRDIRIFNSTGVLVQQLQSAINREVTLNISTLKPGLYILDIGEGQNRKQVKFTKE
ncbi:MAG TPA: T9SS type A sorting domain-containing protein [Bacteroidales bacterium]|nr:T9SS type A sorting domain-containing protein [Bacteroidales bacterium]